MYFQGGQGQELRAHLGYIGKGHDAWKNARYKESLSSFRYRDLGLTYMVLQAACIAVAVACEAVGCDMTCSDTTRSESRFQALLLLSP